jgi:hypothetical protein
MSLYTFLSNLLNVLVQIANKMGLQKKNKTNTVYEMIIPIAVAPWPKKRNIIALSGTVIVGSNPARGMDVCGFSVFVFCPV